MALRNIALLENINWINILISSLYTHTHTPIYKLSLIHSKTHSSLLPESGQIIISDLINSVSYFCRAQSPYGFVTNFLSEIVGCRGGMGLVKGYFWLKRKREMIKFQLLLNKKGLTYSKLHWKSFFLNFLKIYLLQLLFSPDKIILF